ncbi:MAG TPA: replication protein RepA [Bryobacteraceae bacterium]|nr:replication protein RepA [Bryobacteraceae bacterium]
MKNSHLTGAFPGVIKRRSMERAGAILHQTHRELIVSKRTIEKAKGVEVVRIKREQANQALCFSSRPFVLCGLPVRPLPQNQLIYQRRNGQFVLQITGHPDYGVPFGQDRIVPIFLATLAVQQKSPIIRFRSAGEMLETFGMHKGGKEYRRLVSAFERIFGATIFFGTDQIRAATKLVQRTRFNFLREAQIWYNRRSDQPVLSDEFENVVVLSDDFYREISAHPIPTDLDAVRVLSASPAVLDLFMWLSYRCFSAKGEETIPLSGGLGLAAQLGNAEYARPRKFREKLIDWLQVIKSMWPECPAKLSADGQSLLLRPAAALSARRTA